MKKIPLILTAVIMTMLSFGCSEEWMMALNGTRVISDDSESQSGSRWSLCKEGSYEEVEYPADTFTAINADSYYISFGSDKVNYNGTEYSFRKTDNRYDLWSKSDGSSSLSIYATFYVTKQTDTTLITYWPALSKYRAYLKTKVCTVTYNANGGKITQKTQSVAVTGSSVRVTLVSAYSLGLSRTGYIFKGWATSSTGSVKYTDMDSVTVSSNITLYAVWKRDTVTVTFNANGGSFLTSGRMNQIMDKGAATKLMTSSWSGLYRTGYSFQGWALSSSGDVIYTDGANVTLTYNTTLYAVWKPSDITITFNPNGGTIGAVKTQSMSYNTYAYLKTAQTLGLTRAGYQFAGWAETSTASSASYTDGAYVSFSADKTLYAVWTVFRPSNPVERIITFDPNGGTIGDDTYQCIPYNTYVYLKTAQTLGLTRAGYQFAGWAETSTASSASYTDGAYVSFSVDKTLYAVWTVSLPSDTTSDRTTLTVTGNIQIGNVEYDKTSFVKVMYTAVTVIGSDDNWSNYLDSSAPDYYKGAFIAGRTVKLSPYYMAQYQVTQQFYEAVMNSGTNYDWGQGDTHPAYYVSWYDAITFCNKLSLLMGKEPCYTVSGITDWAGLAYSSIPTSNNSVWNEAACDITKNGYRLPTEAEWEFAARSGYPSNVAWKYAFSGIDVASGNKIYNGSSYLTTDANLATVGWYSSNSGSSTHPVGDKTANRLGIYDMSGNLCEWCQDWYNATVTSNDSAYIVSGTVTNPLGAASGSDRVLRGGYWNRNAYICCVSYRSSNYPSNRYYNIGFRPVCSAE